MPNPIDLNLLTDKIRSEADRLRRAIPTADVAAARVFAAVETMVDDTYTGGAMALAMRALDADPDALAAVDEERKAFVGLLFAVNATDLNDTDTFAYLGFPVRTASLAFHVGDDTARSFMRDGGGRDGGGMFGLPVTVIDGPAWETRAAIAWLRARPASADHWAMVEALLAC